jgi:enamine deaminase RidA (YjgF/YER057c/UK114 family)
MLIKRNPDGLPPPFSPYSHSVEAPAGARWLHVSGQVGVDAEGRLAEGPQGQMKQTWHNVLAALADAGMAPHDLVKVTGYLIRPDEVPLFRHVRDALLDGARPASTLVIVAGLAHPDWLVEIEAVAAQP